MSDMLFNVTQDELRMAIVNNGDIDDLQLQREAYEETKSNIYKARVTSMEASIDAVFVEYGAEKHGFLPLKEISPEYFITPVPEGETPDVNRLLKVGQELVIQVQKEERGSKGAAVTTFISLAGAYLVLIPNNGKGGGISRRIAGEEREQLKEKIDQLQVPEGMSVIIRTAGVDKSFPELEWDLSTLLQYWEAIKRAAVAKPGYYLIHREGDIIIRTIRDHLNKDIERIIIDDETAYETAKQYITQTRPDYLSKISLYTDKLPLFNRFNIEQQIEKAYQPEIKLPSGGTIVIDTTEALVAIDINSARANKGKNIEETARNTNLEAAKEIARQLRIRDIGGLIVIDFIDMLSSKSQREVENCLKESLHADRARIQIGRISKFGLLEMSRQRLRSALTKMAYDNCPRCAGTGKVKSIESTTLSILNLLRDRTLSTSGHIFYLQVPLAIASYLMNERRAMIQEIEADTNNTIIIIPNEHLQAPDYEIKSIPADQKKALPSYQINKVVKTSRTAKKSEPKQKAIPAVTQYLSQTNPVPRPRSDSGLVKRLWQLISGTHSGPTPKAESPQAPTPRASTPSQPKDHTQERKRPSSGQQRSQSRRGNRGGSNQRNRAQRTEQRTPAEKSQTDRKKSTPIQAVPAIKPAPEKASEKENLQPSAVTHNDTPPAAPAALKSNPAHDLPPAKNTTPAAKQVEPAPAKTQEPAQQAASAKPSELQQVKTIAKAPDSQSTDS